MLPLHRGIYFTSFYSFYKRVLWLIVISGSPEATAALEDPDKSSLFPERKVWFIYFSYFNYLTLQRIWFRKQYILQAFQNSVTLVPGSNSTSATRRSSCRSLCAIQWGWRSPHPMTDKHKARKGTFKPFVNFDEAWNLFPHFSIPHQGFNSSLQCWNWFTRDGMVK